MLHTPARPLLTSGKGFLFSHLGKNSDNIPILSLYLVQYLPGLCYLLCCSGRAGFFNILLISETLTDFHGTFKNTNQEQNMGCKGGKSGKGGKKGGR